MKIFVTGHSCRSGGGVSVGKNLFLAFGRVAPEHEYFFTVPPDLGYEECCRTIPKHEILVYRTMGLASRWYWETVQLPALIQKFHPDILFNAANRGLVSPPCSQATLIHDAHLFYPTSHFGAILLQERLKFWYHRHHLRRSLKATQLLFCQTPTAEQRLRFMYGSGLEIRLCPNTPSVYLQPTENSVEPEPLQPLRDKFKLFILTRYYTHKNLEIIPQVFLAHRRELKDVAVVLTIASDQHPNARRLLQNIKRYGLEQNIVSVGPLQQEDLAAYYQHTNALLLPTLLESFSGTYMEAIQFSRPILTSDMDFARAICGNAAVYFDPRNVDDICNAILNLKNNQELYQKLVQEGQTQRQKQFLPWDNVAGNVIRELETTVRKVGRPS